MAGTLLEVDGLTKRFGGFVALNRVSLAVKAGERFGLIGPNGSGKTTLINCVSGSLPVDGGRIVFEGGDITGLPPHRRTRLGIVRSFQIPKPFTSMTVTENLELGSYTREARHHKAESLRAVLELFPRLGERRRQLAGTLSGGEQQMLAIGRGLMARPRLLMLDEPSLGLAPIMVRELFSVIQQIRTQGVTVLLVEQNVLAALRLADRGYVLETGRVVLQGTAGELLASEHIKAAYLGL